MISKQIYEEHVSYSWSEDSIRLILTPSLFAKSIYFYIQETGCFQTTESYYTERKNLNSFLIVYTLSGKGVLRYLGEEFTLSAGQCFFINCMNHHFYQTVSGEKWEFLWLHFNGTNALGYYEEFIRNGFKIINCQDSSKIKFPMQHIISINQKRNASTEVITSNLITNLLTELMVQTITSDTNTLIMPSYLKDILKYIDKNFHTSLCLDDFSTNYGISKFHLSKEFKKYTGTTLNEYIITTRLSYAKELLKYTNLPVSEIVYLCGMNHISHFINLFKARENVTPLVYRKEWGK